MVYTDAQTHKKRLGESFLEPSNQGSYPTAKEMASTA